MVFLFMNQKKFSIVTFGCQMNVHDSEKMAGVLQRQGYIISEDPKDADLIILNTCSIREKAEQKFFSELGRLKKLKKRKTGLKIGVAGCVAQHGSEEIFRRAPHVDFVFGPQNIGLLDKLIGGRLVKATADNPEIAITDLPAWRRTEGRAWVTIMYGCNNFCSYCVVPYTRGRERSRPWQNVLREIRDLAEKGFREITLLGQNVNSYRSDVDFPGLLKAVNSLKGIERIRFVTSHPRDLSDDLISAIGNLEKVCEHIHLPMQSGSDRILGLMNRRYSYSDYRRKIDELRSRVEGIAITTDIIAGFPGETAEDHTLTMKALRDIAFDGAFAFKFSARRGTRAAMMEDTVNEDIKDGRLSEILVLQDSITGEVNKRLESSVQEIMVEGPSETDGNMLTGRTRTNKIVNFKGNGLSAGELVETKIVRAGRHSLIGEVL
jgi:tRNA-2-methylthio-N6-dimethylallyladenosine synthase